jgi:predicted DCC family thiol-disulfide oxidoreductase YuxK
MVDRSKSLLLFDGACNFCNGAVLFVIDRDPHERFVFAPLQSELGKQTLRANGLDAMLEERTPPAAGQAGALTGSASMVLIEGGRAYLRSAAALRVVLRLRWPWPLLYAGLLVPRFLRDWAYETFAARRYWFGQSDSCRVPTPELRRRFVG